MPRRSRSSNQKGRLIAYTLFGVAAVAALVFGKLTLDQRAKHFSGLDELKAAELKKSGTSLSGNEYRVTGKITDRIILRGDRGLLVSIKPGADDGQSGLVPVHVPPGVDKINLERGQRYTFKVEVDREGVPVALDIKAQ